MADVRWFRPKHLSLLDEFERSRVARLARNGDKLRCAVGAVLSRLALAEILDVRPIDVTIKRTCPRCGGPHGKPTVPGDGAHMSVSHSSSVVVVAVTRLAPVGVDVERRKQRGLSALSRHVLTAAEPLKHDDELLTYWCRKESVVKATGHALPTHLSDVVVSSAQVPARLVSYRGQALQATMMDLDLGPGYVGALTLLNDESIQIRTVCALPLLVRYARHARR